MKKDRNVYLKHIIDAINQIQDYVRKVGYKEFSSNRMIQDAVIREIEIIGEATKNLPAQIREKYPAVTWKEMAGMRDKLIHSYFGVDLDAVWDTVNEDLPSLKKKIKEIIELEENSS